MTEKSFTILTHKPGEVSSVRKKKKRRNTQGLVLDAKKVALKLFAENISDVQIRAI